MKLKNIVRKTVKVVRATSGAEAVLFVTGEKGSAYRLAQKVGPDKYKLIQSNIGTRYDGQIIDLGLLKEGKLEKQARLELGDYIAARGNHVKVEVISKAEAIKRAKHPVTVRRHNGTQVGLKVTSLDSQYAASVEVFPKTGVTHFFQMESKRIAGRNEKHYGALVKAK